MILSKLTRILKNSRIECSELWKKIAKSSRTSLRTLAESSCKSRVETKTQKNRIQCHRRSRAIKLIWNWTWMNCQNIHLKGRLPGKFQTPITDCHHKCLAGRNLHQLNKGLTLLEDHLPVHNQGKLGRNQHQDAKVKHMDQDDLSVALNNRLIQN